MKIHFRNVLCALTNICSCITIIVCGICLSKETYVEVINRNQNRCTIDDIKNKLIVIIITCCLQIISISIYLFGGGIKTEDKNRITKRQTVLVHTNTIVGLSIGIILYFWYDTYHGCIGNKLVDNIIFSYIIFCFSSIVVNMVLIIMEYDSLRKKVENIKNYI